MSYLGENIRKLGFGLMRLPQTDGVIDVEQTKEMVDLFMDVLILIPHGLTQVPKMPSVRHW